VQEQVAMTQSFIFFALCIATIALLACSTETKPPQTNDGAPMVRVPAGEFLMGAASLDNDGPDHRVKLSEFWIDTYEVTNARYALCVSADKCSPPARTSSNTRSSYYGDTRFENFPVVLISWYDADMFCKWAGKHLPTEAQWEKAARGTDGRFYPWGNKFDPARVNSTLNGFLDTVAVGTYPDGVSPYGAHDMSGNVWEWVGDWFDERYYYDSPAENPQGPKLGREKGVRGGGYGVYDAVMRTTYRRSVLPEREFVFIGFRCAWSAQ
jgi:formylglycine-generating enzyme required for sulfatase activity